MGARKRTQLESGTGIDRAQLGVILGPLGLLPPVPADLALDDIHEGVVVTEPAMDRPGPRIVYANPAFTRLTGFSASEVLGRTTQILNGPKTEPNLYERVKGQLEINGRCEMEAIHYRKGGGEFVDQWFVMPLVDRHGKVVHLLNVHRDVTEQRKAERSAARLETVVESLQAAVLILGSNLSVRYTNPAMTALVGKSRDELLGRFVSQLPCLEAGSGGVALKDALEGLSPHETWRGDLELVGTGGQHVTLESCISSVQFDAAADACFVVVGRDITQQRRLDAVASALNMTENTGYIFAGIRHELGNPVNSLKTALTVVRNNIHIYPREKLADYLERMIDEVSRMEYLLGSLKSVSPSTRVPIQSVDLPAFVSLFIPLVTRDMQRRKIELDVASVDEELLVQANSHALHQVLLNLINNAADAVAGVAGPRILITVKTCGSEIQLTVSDNGCGMTQEQQDRLFMPFHTSKPHGTGLGLVITQRLVAQMNGTLSIYSQRGEGTRVVVSFERSPN